MSIKFTKFLKMNFPADKANIGGLLQSAGGLKLLEVLRVLAHCKILTNNYFVFHK